MRPRLNYLALLAGVLLAIGCGDNSKPASPTPDANPGLDAGTQASCVDGPGELSRPPDGSLPCDLYPPER